MYRDLSSLGSGTVQVMSLVYPVPAWSPVGARDGAWSHHGDSSSPEPPTRGPAEPTSTRVTFCGCAASVPEAVGECLSWILPRWRRWGWTNLEAERLLRSL